MGIHPKTMVDTKYAARRKNSRSSARSRAVARLSTRSAARRLHCGDPTSSGAPGGCGRDTPCTPPHHHPCPPPRPRTGQTDNDPAAGSPTATLLRLASYPAAEARRSPSSPRLPSETVTGGVYKLQGRIHRGLLSRRYWGFLVRGAVARAGPSPRDHAVQRARTVLRVRPRPSEGITDLLSPGPPARRAPVLGSHRFRQLSRSSRQRFAAAMHHSCAPRACGLGRARAW
jgi:hypothetical protein